MLAFFDAQIIEQLFVLWNKHIDRLLDEARRGKK